MKRIQSTLIAIMIILFLPLQAQSQLVTAFPNLSFLRPVDLQNAGDGSNRIFVVEQRGVISVFPNDSLASQNDRKTYLDIQPRVDDSGDEEGLLGLAFHPDYASNGYFFVNYTTNSPNRTIIERYKVSANDPDLADADSSLLIMSIERPFSNHNAGQLAFGPDGYLYISTGDGGSGGDPLNHAQRRETMLGNMLRIDVNASTSVEPYRIPPDNPYVGNTDGFFEEIYAYGFRNTWRFSFDTVTGNLWAADVGQGNWEEIDIVVNGGNYGWRIMEGNHCYDPSSGCDTSGKILPVWEYPHSNGNVSITGGYVYRGNRLPGLTGKYVYADYVTGRIWALDYDGVNPTVNTFLLDAPFNISSFGQDEAKNLYMCAFNGGIYKFGADLTGIESPELLPGTFLLGANYPNPFNPRTLIPVELSDNATVELRIHDVQGRLVDTIDARALTAGSHTLRWDALAAPGEKAASGIYFYSLVVNQQLVQTRQMILLQ